MKLHTTQLFFFIQLKNFNSFMNANIFLFTFGSILLVFCIQKSYINRPQTYSDYINHKVYKAPEIIWGNHKENPNPPRLSKSTPVNETLYVMIFDSEFKADHFQCIAKKQWIEPFLKEPFVDGVEIYSRSRWFNKECNLSTIVTPKPPKKYLIANPSSWVLSNALKMFLERSNSGWLLLIGDSAYIKIDLFKQFFHSFILNKDPLKSPTASGGCIDQRYFFQMFIVESGILFSRNAIENIFNEKSLATWNITYQIGLNADEALSQITTGNYLFPRSRSNDCFLGREFVSSNDFVTLEKISSLYQSESTSNESFNEIIQTMLPKCEIPSYYYNINPGMQGLCSKRITSLNDVFIWSASGANKTKLEFLTNADRLISNLPNSVGYFWNPDKPQLCYISKGKYSQ